MQHTDGHHVLGLGQCAPHRHRSFELAVVVFGLPGFATGLSRRVEQRGIVHHRHGRDAFFQRGGVDERLETGAGLAPGLSYVVELAFLEIEPTHQRPHPAAAWVQCHECRLHLGQLGDAPGVRTGLDHTDHGPRTDFDVGAGFFGQAGLRRPQTFSGDLERLPVLTHRHHFACRRGQHHGRHQIVIVRALIERLVDGIVARRLFAGQVDEKLRSTVDLPALVIQHTLAQRTVSGFLFGRTQAGGDNQSAGVGLIPVLRNHGLSHHLGHIVGVYLTPDTPHRSQLEFLGLGLFRLSLGDEAVFFHALNDVELAGARTFRVGDRVVCRRGLGEPRQHGRLGNAHVLQWFAKVGLGRCREAIGTLPQKNLVHVDLKDLLLGQLMLQFERQQDLVDLARVAFFRGEEHIARHLHGDGGRALALGFAQVGQRRAQHATVVHAVMLKKARVFDRQDGVFHHLGNFIDGQQVASLLPELADQLSIRREHAKRQLGSVVGQVGHIRKIGVGHRQRDAHCNQNRHRASDRHSHQPDQRPAQPNQNATPGEGGGRTGSLCRVFVLWHVVGQGEEVRL